jgi:hypothetical protein
MAFWTFYDYVELSGRNPIRKWIGQLSDGDRAKVDYRLLQMAGEEVWREKWISRYRGTKELFEFRISGNRVEHRPLGSYFGTKGYILLIGTSERDGKIPKSDVTTAERRLVNAQNDRRYCVEHQFDGASDLEEDGEESLS